MKRIIHFSVFLAFLISVWLLTGSCSIAATQAVTASSMRQGGFYVGIAGGVAFPSNSVNIWWPTGSWSTGYVIDGQIGYWYKNFRFAGAMDYYNHQLAQTPSWMVGMTTFMGNVYYDFKFSRFIIPYLGLGAGWLSATLTYNTQFLLNSPSRSSFAYQGIAGFALPINANINIDLSYHYLNWTNAAGNDNAIEAGLNFFF